MRVREPIFQVCRFSPKSYVRPGGRVRGRVIVAMHINVCRNEQFIVCADRSAIDAGQGRSSRAIIGIRSVVRLAPLEIVNQAGRGVPGSTLALERCRGSIPSTTLAIE